MADQRRFAKVTLLDGEPVATILTPDTQAVEGEVLFVYLPLAPGYIVGISFYDMPREQALFYSTMRIGDVIMAVAQASVGLARETESWYMLTIQSEGRAVLKPQRFTREIASMLDKLALGWLNPMILRDGQTWALDVALNDEARARAELTHIMKRWSIRSWELTIKRDGIHP